MVHWTWKARNMSDTPAAITRFLSAWTARDPQLAAAEVTDTVVLVDPNERHEGRDALVVHLEQVLRRFDFQSTAIEHCVVDGDPLGDAQVAFILRVKMTGRSSRLAGVVSGFDAGVFVTLVGAKIDRYTEFWDPTPMAAALSGAATSAAKG